MKGTRKRLTNSQSELVAIYLPKKIQKDRKIPTSVKLVLANIYQLHYLQKNWGKRTVFCSLDKFIKDIEANDKNEVVRPQAYLMANDMVYINPGVRGRATEYSLNDELYELLPTMFKGELSDNFMKFKEDNQLNIKQLETENQEVIVPSHNSMIDSELQHLNVHPDTDTEPELEKESNINQTIVHVTEDKNENTMNDMKINQTNIYENPVDMLYDDELYEILELEPDREEEERIRKDYINSINNGSINNKSQIHSIDNDYVSWVFDKYDYFLDELFKTRSREMYKYYEGRLIELTHNLQKEKFTEPQWNVVLKKFNRWEGIEKCNRYSGMAVPSHNTSIEETNDTPTPQTTDMLTNEDIMRAYMTEEELAQYGVASTVEEPMVAYGNNSVKEAQEQFAMALAANG